MDPIDSSKNIPGTQPVEKNTDLSEFGLTDSDSKVIEHEAGIFAAKNFVPVKGTVKFVGVGTGNKIIYEDEGKMQLANNQTELAESKLDEDFNISGFFGGFFGKKSMFSKKNDNIV